MKTFRKAVEEEAAERPAESPSLGIEVPDSWLSYEYVRNPRHFSEPEVVGAALARGCYQVMSLAAPYLAGDARALFEKLAAQYLES